MDGNVEEEIVKNFNKRKTKNRAFVLRDQEKMAQGLIKKAMEIEYDKDGKAKSMSMKEFREKAKSIEGRFSSNRRTNFESQEEAGQDLLKRAKEQEMPMRNFKREARRIERKYSNNAEDVEKNTFNKSKKKIDVDINRKKPSPSKGKLSGFLTTGVLAVAGVAAAGYALSGKGVDDSEQERYRKRLQMESMRRG